MSLIPISENLALIRTCFSNAEAWQSLLREATNPEEPFGAYFHVVDNLFFCDKEAEEIRALLPTDYSPTAIFIADDRAISEVGHPCLIVGIVGTECLFFRALARELASLDNNLSIGNMDIEEFKAAAGPDGVFRGFE